MAVTFDTFSSGGTKTAVTTLTVAHTVAANAESALFVLAGRGENTDDASITLTCTYNAVSMTSVTSSKVHSEASNKGFVEAFCIALGTGDNTSHNIVLTTNSTLETNFDALNLVGVSAFGVDQATPFNGATSATGNSASPSVTRASATGNLVLFMHGCGSNFTAYGQTGLARVNTNELTRCGTLQGERAAGAASVTSTATAGSDSWASVGIDVKASAATFDVPLIRPVPTQTVWRM